MLGRTSVRILVSFALVVAAGACTTTPKTDDEPAVRGAFERLNELQPVDIAVAPVRDQTRTQRVPLDVFRGAFIDSMIERRYTPLAPTYVDANWVESSFKGTPPPDALLVVAVTGWDPSRLYSTGRVAASADVVLFEGGDTTGKVLWQRTLEHEVDLGDGRGNPPAAGTDLIPKAVKTFAQEVLRELPMRDPVAAARASGAPLPGTTAATSPK